MRWIHRAARWLAGLAAVAALAGCGSLNSFRMAAPGVFGMDRAGTALYVEPSMAPELREQVAQRIAQGRAQVERFFGSIESVPYVAACETPECARRFGSYGERAAALGDGAIRLSHNGLAAPLVAHEMTHTEVFRRVGGWWAIGRLPRWFDEGLAVVIADEPLHSEANWAEIQRRGLSVPAFTELVTRAQWIDALRRYGETEGDVPANLRVVYTTAGHELRRWLACAGAPGTLALLAAVRDGEAFEAAYTRLGAPCASAAAH